ncbi:hypothetical protein TREMEDRAFT_59179 [Tremella mesenterica DSM 1558]|uniref:uncharacterized protein n=1 Tax=Tremella mesenterica (strain ATCC 24925 / CBS 8224 / DSM 1558 / NBRC 9311 / NRRL Y-6157 / RJB 2259-6 / UBC 559-6) TaxID=578456 RepID=UPI0003F48C2A|nr:uncharacterized protein TREMEDRAFT_59179 [Tremella mesenterica DSM 1558]EIW73014.1 hypothetical protein TREMEDRAFT_59179 [Tremella mesenterica DSM 1558]
MGDQPPPYEAPEVLPDYTCHDAPPYTRTSGPPALPWGDLDTNTRQEGIKLLTRAFHSAQGIAACHQKLFYPSRNGSTHHKDEAERYTRMADKFDAQLKTLNVTLSPDSTVSTGSQILRWSLELNDFSLFHLVAPYIQNATTPVSGDTAGMHCDGVIEFAQSVRQLAGALDLPAASQYRPNYRALPPLWIDQALRIEELLSGQGSAVPAPSAITLEQLPQCENRVYFFIKSHGSSLFPLTDAVTECLASHEQPSAQSSTLSQ